MKRLILSALAILGMGTMATEANAQFYVCKDGSVVYSMTSDVPDSITFHKPVFDAQPSQPTPQLPSGQYNGHDYIDLGLSVKWATVNIGAEKPEDYGYYIAWGETTTITKESYLSDTYKYYAKRMTAEAIPAVPAHTDADGFPVAATPEIPAQYETGYTKYVPSSKASGYGYDGFSDDKTTLELSDDAANVNWGGSWRMPTYSEWKELQTKCTWTRTTKNGVSGYKVTSNIAGYTDKWIFLPAAGYRYSYLGNAGSYGYYWSSSLYEGLPYNAWYMYFYSSRVDTYNNSRYYGQSVRPVAE
ncbi:MAG: fibrobacter succinogenes major paralogous domain-containing protein [Bacteroidales bacterium]|nr:fibrobacter succinogenes major paralogous domain-containing protein [Bacteroidales bacterium]